MTKVSLCNILVTAESINLELQELLGGMVVVDIEQKTLYVSMMLEGRIYNISGKAQVV